MPERAAGLSGVKTDVTVIKWMLGFILAFQIGILVMLCDG